MRDSAPAIVHDTRRRLPGGHVPFYDDRPWRPEHGLVPAPWIESAEADGCECCTPEDLARFLRALWAGDPRMRTPQPPVGDADYEYGYGLVIEPDGFGHGGDMPGYVAHMWADEASGYGVVAFANGIAGAFALGEAALALARGDEPEPWSPELAEPLVDDGSCPPAWQPYLGRYRAHNPWRPTFLVAAREGELVLGHRLAGQRAAAAGAARRCGVPRRRTGVVAGAGALRQRTATGGPSGRRSPACRTTGRSAAS